MRHFSEARYNRFVSVLREQSKGYATSHSRKPRGYVIIDVKEKYAKMVVQVKNLRPLDHSPYDIIMAYSGSHKIKYLPIGKLQVDSRGEGESRLEFESNNLGGTGVGVDKFFRVFIVAPGKRMIGSRKRVPLMGDLELQVAEPFDALNIEKVEPFGTNTPNHHWWKFYPNSYLPDRMEDVPTDHHVPSMRDQSPGYRPEIKSGPVFRGHQLIGLHYDEKGAVDFLVHGIPGRFCLQDQPDGGHSGYVYWHPLPGQDYLEGNYGYWLIHINPENGEVVLPEKQTPPSGNSIAQQEDG